MTTAAALAVAAPPRASRANNGGAMVWVVPPLLLLAALFFYPLGLIAAQSVSSASGAFSLDAYAAVLGGPLFANALFHTIEIALGATAGCIALGFTMALILSFVPFPGARMFSRLIDTVIALPTFLVALAFTFIYGSAGLLNAAAMQATGAVSPPIDFLYSPAGVILAEVTVYTPFIMRPLLAAFSLIETAQIEVASSLGAGSWRIVRQIIIPAAMPALLAGGSLCLLLTVNEFGIVFFIGAKGVITLPLLIYDKAIQEFDYTTACVIAVVNVALSLALYALYRTSLGRMGRGRAGVG
ncbi:MAG TPA: 2-aminoethylphosphonate ABC transporter permease subunit [Acidisphaera sp.]|nr:2-aminoethylphosphonate ABC transporter permease subunit [Acidisphaera sp.]